MKAFTPALLIGLFAFGLLMRVVSHVPNFSPLLAISLFVGFLVPKKQAVLIPVSLLIISDMILGFHDLSLLVWLCYGTMTYIAGRTLKDENLKRSFGLAAAGSLGFFLITNFAVWLQGEMYAMTWQGLTQCYVAGLPFFRNALIADLFYTGSFFGMYVLAQDYYTKKELPA